MQTLIKSWVKPFIIVWIFGVCINLIYLALPIYIMIVYDRVLYSFSKATLSTMSVGVLISLVMMGLLEYFRMRMLGQAGNSLAQKMMPFVLKSIYRNAAGINRQGYIRGLYDLEFLRNTIVQGQIFYIFDLPWVLIYLGILYFIHPLIGGVATAVIFMSAFFQILLRKLEQKRFTIADVAFQANAEFARISLRQAEPAAVMGITSPLKERYQDGYHKVLAVQSEADIFYSGIGTAVRFLHVIALAAVFGAGAFAFFSEEITAGAIFASVLIIARLFYPFERSLSDMKVSIEAMAAYKRLNHFVSWEEQKTQLSLPVPQGKFEAEGITLALNDKTVLHNISFALEPGETLGIVGPSSVGKTSLCKVLLGIWPAAAGKVRLDGAEIAQWPEDDFGKYVGYMPQEPELFPASVAENISRLLEVDSEKVVKAAQKAGIHEMILKLPRGYDTKIDQTGKNLSAGQRHLIALARALYDDPRLVVLDEPHAHQDDLGLRFVLQALNTLKQENITTIVVSDRSNLIMSMDKILVIKDGQVAKYGPVKEVLGQLASGQQPQQASGV
jgi:ATP-binding cassette, subfamily C, bacterial EexD